MNRARRIADLNRALERALLEVERLRRDRDGHIVAMFHENPELTPLAVSRIVAEQHGHNFTLPGLSAGNVRRIKETGGA